MITSFSGAHEFLSNFHPCQVRLDGDAYPSVEHAYQAAKTTDRDVRRMIAYRATPGEAKAAGRRIDPIRPDWKQVKVGVMADLVHQKFTNRKLRALLLATGEEDLVEGNWWGDVFWGVCRGVGENQLGLILMKERAAIRRRMRPRASA